MNSPPSIARRFPAFSLALFLGLLAPRAGAQEEDLTPCPLSALLRQSDAVVLAQCASNSTVADGEHLLDFQTTQVLKSGRPLAAFRLLLHARNEFYPRLIHRRPVLLFLDEKSPEGYSLRFALDLDAGSPDLRQVARAVSRLAALRHLPAVDQPAERKAFALENLQAPDGSVLRLTAAVELQNWARTQRQKVSLEPTNLALVVRIAQTSRDPRVIFPLCRFLQDAGAPEADAASVRAITDFDAAAAGEYELATVVNGRPALRRKLVELARQETDPARLDRLVEHLSRVLDSNTRRELEEIWNANATARGVVLGYTNRLSAEDQHAFQPR